MSEPRIARHWDSVNPVLYDGDEAISLRVLEHKYRKMEEALNAIANHGMDTRQCRDLAYRTLEEIKK